MMSGLGNKEIMSRNIQKYMKAKGLNRQQLSDNLEVSYTTLSDWINAKTYPRIDKIELMANYFGIEKSDLVEDHNFKMRKSKNLNTIAKYIDENTTDEQMNKIIEYIKFVTRNN